MERSNQFGRKGTLINLFLALLFSCASDAEIIATPVDYQQQGTTLKGFIAYDNQFSGKRPAVLVVHEWWGHNEYARKRAKMLAKLGYTALAVDMYGNGKQAAHPEEAGKFASEIAQHRDVGIARFEAAMTLLKNNETVDKNKIAAIGYCFGGAVVLEMARAGLDLDGVVSFHGSLATQAPARNGRVKAKILVAHGEKDPFVKPEDVENFKKEMDAAGVDYHFNVYPDALHSFTNPDATSYGEKFNLPLKYDESADHQSWADMKRFLKRVFQ
ncbi:MAG: dienelactone hydrolase family protein [Gammaproteobacteria bacterium]